MLRNRVFRLYSNVPHQIFEWLGIYAGPHLVRQFGRKIGPSDWYYVTVVVRESPAATSFEDWLHARGERGRLEIEVPYPSRTEILSIEEAVWVTAIGTDAGLT